VTVVGRRRDPLAATVGADGDLVVADLATVDGAGLVANHLAQTRRRCAVLGR
jgi:hypothetical protein